MRKRNKTPPASTCWLLLIFPFVCLWTGCVYSTNRATVTSRFQTIHGCRPDSVWRVGSGGYVVRGCGIESHFVCFDTGNHDNEHGVVGMLFDLATDEYNETCIHEYSRGKYRSRLQAPPALTVSRTDNGEDRLRATFMLNEGLLTIVGVPAQFTNQVGCSYRPLTDSPLPNHCAIQFWVDGESIEPQKIVQPKDGSTPDVRFILRPDDLVRIYRSDRSVGILCAAPVRFNDKHRETMKNFVAQFDEKALTALH